MNKPWTDLHWHRHRPGVWWLAYTDVLPMHSSCMLRLRADGAWMAHMPTGTLFPIRRRDLREAMDCARRWAEYRGYEVAERFPTEVQPPSPPLAETNRRLAAMPPAQITAEDARRQVEEHRVESLAEIKKGNNANV